MKITGLDTWGSDILFVKSAFAQNILKPLLLLGCKTSSDVRLPNKTLITSASLHHHKEKSEQHYLVIHARMITKKISRLFHIVEQKFSVFTPDVKKQVRSMHGYELGHFQSFHNVELWV